MKTTDPDHPVICFDETSKQLVADKRLSIGARPGRVERYDYEYKRNGTRNLFMFCEPKAGWRHVEVTERRTAVDFAHQMRWLADEAYPHTKTIRLVLDNLNTHKLGSLYDVFEPAEARRIAKRLEFHYTPSSDTADSTGPTCSSGSPSWVRKRSSFVGCARTSV